MITHKHLDFNGNTNRYEMWIHDFCGNNFNNRFQSMIGLFVSPIDESIWLYVEDFNCLEKQYWFLLTEEQATVLFDLYDNDKELTPKEAVEMFKNNVQDYERFSALFH